MNKFRVLLVDDQVQYLEQLTPLREEIAGLEIVHASSQQEALEAIETGFYQLAIVDVSLRGQARMDTDGLFVLKRLAEVRPTCERVLFTTSVGGDDRRKAMQAVAPAHGGAPAVANGYVDKADAELRAPELVRERARAWLHHQVDVHDIGAVLEQLLENDVRGDVELSPQRGTLSPNRDELDFVLSALFGQGLIEPDRRVDMVNSLELHEMSEGWSRSVTMWCEPRSSRSGAGPRCVIKIGPQADTKQEVARYRAYVRYRLRLRHRVELLDWCIGDTIGAVCYSHHEAVEAEQIDLQQLIAREDPAASACVKELFRPEAKQWLADESDEQDMARFFMKEYSRPMQEAVYAVRDFVSRHDELSLEHDGGGVRAGDVRLALPTSVELGSPLLTGPFKGCIVHGDLHGGNVLTAGGDHPVLIDYRNMTRGPRLLDFASLEVSIRMTRGVCERSLDDLVHTDLPAEFAAWRHDWSTEGENGSDTAPYWRHLSTDVRQVARQNFPDATEREYAATCLLRALRVFMARAPEDKHRRRLLIWISMLTSVVSDEADGR